MAALAVFIFLLLYKIGRLTRNILWTWRRGEEYVNERLGFRRSGKETYETVNRLVDRLGGSGPLSLLAGDQRSSKFVNLALVAKKTWRAATSFPALIPATGISLLIFSPHTQESILLHLMLAYACAILIVLAMFAGTVAAFVTTLVLGDFATVHQGFPELSPSPVRTALNRMSAFAGYLLFSWFASAASVASLSSYSLSFERLGPLSQFTPLSLIERFLQSAYFVFLSALGVTEVDAITTRGRALMFLTLANGLSLLVIVLGLIFSTMPNIRSSEFDVLPGKKDRYVGR